MTAFLLRRIAWGVVMLWAVVTLTFAVQFAVGNPVTAIVGPRASARDREHVRRFYELDKPIGYQYVRHLGRMVHGDLGISYRYRRSVTALIAERFPRTLLLALMAMTFEVTFGVAVGVIAAARRGRLADTGIMAGSFVLMSTPTFISGKLLLLLLAYYAGWFPIGGYGVGPIDHIYHAILPAFTLALLSTAYYARLTRNELVEILRADYVRTARAKGLSGPVVVVKHALRNALLPIVTSVGMSFGSLFTGAVVTEAIFAWPGLGRLAYESIANDDRNVILGTVLFGSFGILVGNLLADLAYAALDPRIRRG